ncbi:MAG TPA: aminotransferase class I/II-fold pyridoxal phosphate-dependent enzyme [Thermomicrobiales bacterium]|jgi:aspartate/methionine/tyrosine aminotransferase
MMAGTIGAGRTRGFGSSIFSEMSRLAVQHGAVNLGQGFPDFAGPDFVKAAAHAAIDADLNQYAISHGAPRLRRAIAATWARDWGRELDPETEITVASGATEVLADAMLAFLDPGDEVIVFEPFYDAYQPTIGFAGATPRAVTLHAPDWSIDTDELAAAFTPRTRLLLLNTPHNPTGKVFTEAELAQIAALCIEHDVIAVTDEVYDRIVYHDTGATHLPLATLPGMWERTLTVNSTGKTFSMTGWKIGYAIGPAPLNAALRTVHQFVTFATATPFQEAMAVAIELAAENGYYDQLRCEYAARRDLLAAALRDAGLATLPIGGSYFLLADIAPLGFPDDAAFCRYLAAEIGVAAIPPSAFYLHPSRAPQLARFCFAKRPETIAAAAERLLALRR